MGEDRKLVRAGYTVGKDQKLYLKQAAATLDTDASSLVRRALDYARAEGLFDRPAEEAAS